MALQGTQVAYDALVGVHRGARLHGAPRYLTDDEYRELQWHLARNPEAGDVIRGTGGFRKVRWADRRRGQEASDLTAKERRLLKAALEEEKRQRAHRRVARRE